MVAAYFGVGIMESGRAGRQAWRWPEPWVAGLRPPGSQTCPLGLSPLTVGASIPAVATWEVWKSSGVGSQELGVAQMIGLRQPALGNT